MSGDHRARKRLWVRLAVGALLIIGAAGLYLSKGFGAPDHSRPVVLVLPSDGRWIESAPIHASPGGRYRASLSLERKYPRREMECLADVGMPFPTSTESGRRTDCPAGFSPSQLEWNLVEDGRATNRTYDFGDHAGEYASATVGRSLGIFMLRPGPSYVVRARLRDAPSQLWTTRPKFELAFDDMASLVVQALFFSAISGVMGLIGLGLGFAALLRIASKPTR